MTSDLPAPAERSLERVMGVRQLAASSFNMTVGSGIFVLPAAVAVILGAGAPLAYLICAPAMALVVLCFAEAGSRVSRTGGGYAYAAEAFGPYVGLIAGALLYWGAGVLASAAVMNIFYSTLKIMVPALATTPARIVVMAGGYGGLALLNVLGAKPGVRTVELFSLGKLIPLVALAAVGLFMMHPANLVIPALPPVKDLGRACITLIFAFLGFENSLNPSGEVRDSHRTVPRAVLLALGLVTVLYLTIQMVAQGVLGPQLANETAAPLAAVAGVIFGPMGTTLILAGTLVSTFGYLSGDVLTSPRALFALSERGVLPPFFARIHPRFHSPWVAIITHVLLAGTLAYSGGFLALSIVANVAVLSMYAIVCAGVLMLRHRGVRGEGEPFVLPGGPTIPLAAVVVLALLLRYGATRAEFMATWDVIAVASVLYGISEFWRRRAAPAA